MDRSDNSELNCVNKGDNIKLKERTTSLQQIIETLKNELSEVMKENSKLRGLGRDGSIPHETEELSAYEEWCLPRKV